MLFQAIKKHTYRGSKISINDIYNVHARDVRLLKALKWIQDMPAVGAMSAVNNPELIPRTHNVIVQPSVHEEELIDFSEPLVSEEPLVSDELLNEEPLSEESSDDILSKLDAVVELPGYIDVLRQTARNLGLNIDGRWGVERIQREIDEYNQKTYQTVE